MLRARWIVVVLVASCAGGSDPRPKAAARDAAAPARIDAQVATSAVDASVAIVAPAPTASDLCVPRHVLAQSFVDGDVLRYCWVTGADARTQRCLSIARDGTITGPIAAKPAWVRVAPEDVVATTANDHRTAQVCVKHRCRTLRPAVGADGELASVTIDWPVAARVVTTVTAKASSTAQVDVWAAADGRHLAGGRVPVPGTRAWAVAMGPQVGVVSVTSATSLDLQMYTIAGDALVSGLHLAPVASLIALDAHRAAVVEGGRQLDILDLDAGTRIRTLDLGWLIDGNPDWLVILLPAPYGVVALVNRGSPNGDDLRIGLIDLDGKTPPVRVDPPRCP